MNYISLNDAFNLFASCYIYSCLTYILLLFLAHLADSFLALRSVEKAAKSDFHSQVKELLNPATEAIIKPISHQLQPNFDSMTIRKLRAHIRDNQLQRQIHDSIGKTVSNASKYELIKALV
jgi:hypothetical protein